MQKLEVNLLHFKIFLKCMNLSLRIRVEKSRAALAGVVLRSSIHTWQARRFAVYRWTIFSINVEY